MIDDPSNKSEYASICRLDRSIVRVNDPITRIEVHSVRIAVYVGIDHAVIDPGASIGGEVAPPVDRLSIRNRHRCCAGEDSRTAVLRAV